MLKPGLQVLFVVASITASGTVFVLPVLCSPWDAVCLYAHLALALFLSGQVLIHYGQTVISRPGDVEQYFLDLAEERLLPGGVPRGRFHDYSFCWSCQKPKPPAAHHCRVCRKCVVDMDHHCPFANNCIGRSNLRAFVLFLAWVLLSMAYSLPCCISALSRSRALFSAFASGVAPLLQGNRWWRPEAWPAALSTAAAHLDRQALGMLYCLTLSCAVAVSVTILFVQQLRHVLMGVSYVQLLKRQQQAAPTHLPAPARPSWTNLLQTLGPPRSWIGPSWVNPALDVAQFQLR